MIRNILIGIGLLAACLPLLLFILFLIYDRDESHAPSGAQVVSSSWSPNGSYELQVLKREDLQYEKDRVEPKKVIVYYLLVRTPHWLTPVQRYIFLKSISRDHPCQESEALKARWKDNLTIEIHSLPTAATVSEVIHELRFQGKFFGIESSEITKAGKCP